MKSHLVDAGVWLALTYDAPRTIKLRNAGIPNSATALHSFAASRNSVCCGCLRIAP